MCSLPAKHTAHICLEEDELCKGSWSVSIEKQILLCAHHAKKTLPYLLIDSERICNGI